MKSVKHSSLVMLLVLISCNESISPSLQSGSSSTGSSGSSGSSSSTDYYFGITNTSSTLLNYKLHRTGAGNYNTDCKISSSAVQFDNENYVNEATASPAIDHDSKTWDISCYFEAEELSLYMNGLNFAISASPNTCEYVGYQPYSFYDRMPGDSTTTYTKITCDSTVTDAEATAYLTANAAALTSAGYAVSYGAGPSYASCNKYIDSTMGVANRTLQTVTSDARLCRFDYSQEPVVPGIAAGGNCDIGTVTINEIVITKESGVVRHAVSPQVSQTCNGSPVACIKGAITQTTLLGTNGMEVTETSDATAYYKNYSLSSPYSNKRSSTKELANFRAQLASEELDFQSASTYKQSLILAPINPIPRIWLDDPAKKQFNPNIMEYYAANRIYTTSSQLVQTADLTAFQNANGYKSTPLAAEPYIGLNSSGLTSWRTNPFYTFLCLDASLDIKARIRMVVRDWDRTFSPSGYVPASTDRVTEMISDYVMTAAQNTQSRQDNPIDFEVPGEPGLFYNYNDFEDWDDTVFMLRAPTGAFAAGTTTWTPETGFYDIDNFTNGSF